jgi:hypothetical protein
MNQSESGGDMANPTTCPGCGQALQENWLNCKHCGKAIWPRINPYLIGGAIFSVFGAWGLLSKAQFTNPAFGSLLTAFLPIVGAVFGLIGIVMLIMALVAVLRGTSAK